MLASNLTSPCPKGLGDITVQIFQRPGCRLAPRSPEAAARRPPAPAASLGKGRENPTKSTTGNLKSKSTTSSPMDPFALALGPSTRCPLAGRFPLPLRRSAPGMLSDAPCPQHPSSPAGGLGALLPSRTPWHGCPGPPRVPGDVWPRGPAQGPRLLSAAAPGLGSPPAPWPARRLAGSPAPRHGRRAEAPYSVNDLALGRQGPGQRLRAN